ncbi:aldehyde dehydrogenase family protein [Conexibacter sp. CPCC 206217]|uniref:aldehyde dehydrogenase family protein n=1 Tax=Conexibacter sp. CPCC 206217 TaxID=3064574 RepID=UPI002724143B|nr:aldehyde dehydrogenase family protein [Conexibacter sp. CPCC 206217]MDO8213180.1 aldehyde dehydrogenase family protein [Conexibacter sp. CPCC 206217]
MTVRATAEFSGTDPRTGERAPGAYVDATAAEVAAAARAARAAFLSEGDRRTFSDAALLRAVAEQIDARAAELCEAAERETGLTSARLTGEVARTTGQLRAFADVVDSGELLEPIVDAADPAATPPRPDQRRMNLPIGVVAVWGAGNFPFAFGVAGGDTAAAFAAGCPVVVKAHPSHPRTSELTAEAVHAALLSVGASSAWFSLLQGREHATGVCLATCDDVDAVAFTGSRSGGLALVRAAAERPRPIPVYAEMGAVNPTVVTPAAASARGAQIAQELGGAIVASNGQLCTKPGIIALVDDGAARALVGTLAELLAAGESQPLLDSRTKEAFVRGADELAAAPAVEVIARGAETDRPGSWQAPLLAQVAASALTSGVTQVEEVFGPAAVVAWCADEAELLKLLESLEPALAAGLYAEAEEAALHPIMVRLQRKVGRLVFDGITTGVTVGRATVHGGPFPATSIDGHTSVGMTAPRRFLRPVGFQGFPEAALPAALRRRAAS